MIASTPQSWPEGWISPDLGSGVRALMTARASLATSVPSQAPYDGFNLGDHVGDDPARVLAHRQHLAKALSAEPIWLKQVHGHQLLRLSRENLSNSAEAAADGVFTTELGLVCAIMVADCLPILLAAPHGRGVMALHAGWRGLAGAGAEMNGRGIVDTGVAALCEATACAPSELVAWLGPCIGPSSFQVGADVLVGFGVDPAASHPRFVRQWPGRWLADLPGLAMDRLKAQGVERIGGGQWCTVSEPSRFFSFRRDGVTGRQAACIWIDGRP